LTQRGALVHECGVDRYRRGIDHLAIGYGIVRDLERLWHGGCNGYTAEGGTSKEAPSKGKTSPSSTS